MQSNFDPRDLPRAFYDTKIKELGDKHRELVKAASEVNDEMKWWIEGRDRFAPDEAPEQETLVDVDQAPELDNLRAQIKFVIGQTPGGGLVPIEVIQALDEHGWRPTAKSGDQMVRNRMLDMVAKHQLVKDESGRYSTPEQVEVR